MRAVVQRVSEAEVTVGGASVGVIDGEGLVVLVGVAHSDTEEQARALAAKLYTLRVLAGEKSCADADAPLLVVSQFTLYADTSRGRRPGFTKAAPPELAEKLYLGFATALQDAGVGDVQTGEFGAEMLVELVNDGPFTIWLDTASG